MSSDELILLWIKEPIHYGNTCVREIISRFKD